MLPRKLRNLAALVLATLLSTTTPGAAQTLRLRAPAAPPRAYPGIYRPVPYGAYRLPSVYYPAYPPYTWSYAPPRYPVRIYYSWYTPRYAVYVPVYPPYVPPPSAYQGYYPPAVAEPAYISVWVPADAEIWFDGTRTNGTGSFREYVSPPLTPGRSFTYEVRARWRQDGQEVSQVRRIAVQSGARVTIDFRTTAPSEAPPR